MIETAKLYDVVAFRIALLEQELRANLKLFEKLPVNVFRHFFSINDLPHFAERRKASAIDQLRTKIEGRHYERQYFIDATPFFHLTCGLNQNGINSDGEEFIRGLDGLVAADVARKGLTTQSLPLTLPYATVPLSKIPVFGYKSARDATSLAIDSAVKEREVLRNLARVLKVALNPELAPYYGTPAARIDRLNINEDLLKKSEWRQITAIAAKSLGPISIDEHVIEEGVGAGQIRTAMGVATLVFGKNKYGESDKPVYGIYEWRAYRRQLQLFTTESEAQAAYRILTEPRDGVQVHHTSIGNWVGGGYSSDKHHPNRGIGSPNRSAPEPWGAKNVTVGLNDDVPCRKPAISPFSWCGFRFG